jgi:hypothetical protein
VKNIKGLPGSDDDPHRQEGSLPQSSLNIVGGEHNGLLVGFLHVFYRFPTGRRKQESWKPAGLTIAFPTRNVTYGYFGGGFVSKGAMA